MHDILICDRHNKISLKCTMSATLIDLFTLILFDSRFVNESSSLCDGLNEERGGNELCVAGCLH